MADSTGEHIFFVDDEQEVCRAVGRTLKQGGWKITCFTRAAECLKKLSFQRCDLLITDVKMPGMDGISLLTEVKAMLPSLPVLIITGYGDVPTAVAALKAGASDFIEKPLDRHSFLSTVELLLKGTPRIHPQVRKVLTRTEARVLQLILTGKSNKEIAGLRHRSVRTIEDQRRRIMHKLGAENLVDLVKQVAQVRLPKLPDNG